MFQLLSKPPKPKTVPPGALNELIQLAGQYRKRSEFADLLQFMVRFRMYSSYNAMLIRTQKPGAKYVAPAKRWQEQYRRRIKVGAQSIVILKPMGPVMFVFDVSDTEPMQGAPDLPAEIERPFGVSGSFDSRLLTRVIQNAVRDGVETVHTGFGSQQGGQIETVSGGRTLSFAYGNLFRRKSSAPHRYTVQLSKDVTEAEQYATTIHELAHLYCGHLGSSDERLWPHRLRTSLEAKECEAESVSYIVCRSMGLATRSDAYLAEYLASDADVPEDMDADLLLKVVALLQEMSRRGLPPRKQLGG